MRRRTISALLAGLALCAGLLGGCAGQEDTGESSAVVQEEAVENDGHPASLVLATVEADEARTALLREIADKYQADYPNTEIEIRSYGSREALEEALAQGAADLGEMDEASVPAAVQGGLLLDLYDAVQSWDENYSLSQEAWQAIRSMGRDHAYVIPCDFDQFITYYRTDWFEEYNETAESAITPREWCRNWTQISRTVDRLGDRGRAVFGGEDRLGYLFDAGLWADLSLGRIADPAAAYFAAGDEHTTIFTWEVALESVEAWKENIQALTDPRSLDWTEEEATDAFVRGEAAILFAGSSARKTLEQAMPQGSWGTIGPVQGGSGGAVISDQYVGWGVSAASGEQEIATHFLLYLSNADNNTHFAKESGSLPIHTIGLEMEPSLLEGDRAGEMYMMGKNDWYQYADPPVMYQAYQSWPRQRDQLVRDFLAGGVTGEELLGQMDQYWTRALAEEGDLLYPREEEE